MGRVHSATHGVTLRLIHILIVCALFTGCSTSASGPSFESLPQQPIAAGQSRIYVFRTNEFYLAQAPYIANAPILLDGQPVAKLKNGGFVKLDVQAGPHSISALAGSDRSTRNVDAGAGTEVYVQLYDKSRMSGVGPAVGG